MSNKNKSTNELPTTVIAAYMAFFLLLVAITLMALSGAFETTVEVGQHWQTIKYEENPFEETRVYDYYVIDIQDDYVLYIEVDSFGTDTSNIALEYFSWGKELITEPEE